MIRYKRILLKLSGESLAGAQSYGIDAGRLQDYAEEISQVVASGVQTGIVIGGGNIFRGLSGASKGFDRVKGDQMGMLATVINSLALQSALISAGCPARVFTSIRMEPAGEYYAKEKALEALARGEIAIIAGGTGNPYFTTDTASALRGTEIGAEVLLKGTRVDGVYNADPEKVPGAVRYESLTFGEVYRLGLKVMDLTATTFCMENHLPVIVFNMDKKGNLLRLINGEQVGTLVHV